MESIVGLLGTIIGALIAGTFVFVKEIQQRNFSKNKEKREFLIKKYEEIYKELSELRKQTSEISLLLMGDISNLKNFDPKIISTNIKNNNLEMNVRFYAPNLLNDIEQIRKNCSTIHEISLIMIFKNDIPINDKKILAEKIRLSHDELINNVTATHNKLSEIVINELNS